MESSATPPVPGLKLPFTASSTTMTTRNVCPNYHDFEAN